MYVQQQQQQQQHHHPPNCQHQQQMDDYNCDGQFTNYNNNNNIIPRQINNRIHPTHHDYMTTGYYGAYSHHTHLTHPVLPTTDHELARLSSSSSSSSALHWTKAPSAHDFPPPSSSASGSLVFYGSPDVGGQDWTGTQEHDFLCKDPGALVPCHQLASPDDLTHGGPTGALRRTLAASVAEGGGPASSGGGGGGGGGPGDGSGGSSSTFLSHQQGLRSASTLTTNRHSLGPSSARNLTTLQPGYATHHHPQQQQQQQLRSLCGGSGAVLSLSARSPPGQSELSTAILSRRSEDQQLLRGTLGSAGAGRGEGQAAVGRSTNHNQVPFDWMKKQIYPITPTSGKTRTKDKYRIVYSEHQKVELEKEFLYNPYITIQRKAELATIIGLSDRQVKIWFQNRRAKERKQKKKRPQTTTKAANHVTTNGALEPGVETAPTGGARSLYHHHHHHPPVDHHHQQQQLGRNGGGGGGRLVAVGGSGDVKMEGVCRGGGMAEGAEDGCRPNEVKSESVTNL